METRKYKERPSQIGRIMTNPRSKSEELSETCKKRIEEKFIEDTFGVYKSFWTKEINKGVECEEESINYFVKEFDLFGAKKNEIKFTNDHFVGTPDIVHNGVIYDIKTSWSLFTYPLFDSEIPTKDYIYQLQAYMSLTGLDHAQLVYVLTDSTEDMIQDEIYRRCLRKKIIDVTPKMEEEIRREMTFGHVDPALRVKIFEIEKDDKILEEIIARIELCQKYYDGLVERINNRIKTKNNV